MTPNRQITPKKFIRWVASMKGGFNDPPNEASALV